MPRSRCAVASFRNASRALTVELPRRVGCAGKRQGNTETRSHCRLQVFIARISQILPNTFIASTVLIDNNAVRKHIAP